MRSASGPAFSKTFAVARAKLLEAAAAVPASCMAHVEPSTGAQGETLATDVVRAGAPGARRGLLVTSACHGVEGFAGSAVQLQTLRDRRLLDGLRAGGVELLIVHAMNPHGFSRSRRVTAEGIDLNRNFVDFDRPLPLNADYRVLHPLLVPGTWPPPPENEQALRSAIEARGLRGFQESLTRGQHEFVDGLFFGGFEPSWAHRTFRSVLRAWAPAVREAAWIDIHTGLGRCGEGEPIFTGGSLPEAERLARDWWGEVTRLDDGSSASTRLSGTLANAVQAELGTRLATSITLEFGTVAPLDVLHALRLDAWAHGSGAGRLDDRALAARVARDAFFVDTDAWKNAVLEQGAAAVAAAARGLAGRRGEC